MHYLRMCVDHKGVYVNATNEILVYGGKAYLEEQPKSLRETWPYRVVDDMWYFNFDVCINNCSFQGKCHLGFCEVRLTVRDAGVAIATIYENVAFGYFY